MFDSSHLYNIMLKNFQGKNTNPKVYANVGPLKLLQLYKQCVTGDLDT